MPLAPLHQPHNLAPIRAIAAHAPDLPQVACFDTAFHPGQAAVVQRVRAAARVSRRRACGATGFTACRTSTSPRRLREVAPEIARRAGGDLPSRQRRQPVRDPRRPKRREHDGVHRRSKG